MSGRVIGRRRALAVLGAAAGLAALGLGRRPVEARLVHRWRGIALGAPAEITLVHPEPAVAARLIRQAVAEIRRLEAIVSLYRPDSELSRLNRDGRLAAPSHDLVQLLAEAQRWSAHSDGAFDVTVQPLWELFARHFAAYPGDPVGPPERALAVARARVDHRAVEVAAHAVRLTRPGMAVTLNGIAQGYLTDRIALLLQDAGLADVLVHLGEFRALGRPAADPWQVALPGAAVDGAVPVVALDGRALATSSAAGTRFEPSGRHHHLLDPRSGRSAHSWRSVSVLAPSATAADALATALAVLPPPAAPGLLAGLPGTAALLTGANGRVMQVGDWPAATP